MKLQCCQFALKWWSLSKFGNICKLLKDKNMRLTLLQQTEDPADWDSILTLQREIAQLLEMEDLQWKQRGKRNWFRGGDRNTQYFHSWANHRRKINFIGQIMDELGHSWTNPKEISQAFMQFYQGLVSIALPVAIEECLSNVSPCVTKTMNSQLTRAFFYK